MDTSNMSLSDIKSIMPDDSFGGNNGIWVLLLFLIILGGGIGNWGGNNSSVQGAITRADLNDGLNNSTVLNKLDGITNGLCDGFYTTTSNINNGTNTIVANMTAGINSITQGMNTGFDAVNANITDIGYKMSQGFCDIKTQMLQDKYDSVNSELNLARIAASNATQTQNILSTIGTYKLSCNCPYSI